MFSPFSSSSTSSSNSSITLFYSYTFSSSSPSSYFSSYFSSSSCFISSPIHLILSIYSLTPKLSPLTFFSFFYFLHSYNSSFSLTSFSILFYPSSSILKTTLHEAVHKPPLRALREDEGSTIKNIALDKRAGPPWENTYLASNTASSPPRAPSLSISHNS